MFSRLADESGITYPDLVFGESGAFGTCTCKIVKFEIFNSRKIKKDSFPLRWLGGDVATLS